MTGHDDGKREQQRMERNDEGRPNRPSINIKCKCRVAEKNKQKKGSKNNLIDENMAKDKARCNLLRVSVEKRK